MESPLNSLTYTMLTTCLHVKMYGKSTQLTDIHYAHNLVFTADWIIFFFLNEFTSPSLGFYFQVCVEVMSLYSDDDETTTACCGENVKAKLKGIEEEVSQNYVFLYMV